jgi:hypothetical protein
MSVKGTFVNGADVSVFDPQGKFIVGGTVKSIFEDEIYVDVDKADLVEVGFVVAMNVPRGDAPALINQQRDVVASIKAESARESEERQVENKKVFEADEKERRLEQNEVDRLKFQQEALPDW